MIHISQVGVRNVMVFATQLLFRLVTAATSAGFDNCRSSLRSWRASVEEIFCKAANVAVLIVERRKELLIRGQVPFGEPLQMASK